MFQKKEYYRQKDSLKTIDGLTFNQLYDSVTFKGILCANQKSWITLVNDRQEEQLYDLNELVKVTVDFNNGVVIYAAQSRYK